MTVIHPSLLHRGERMGLILSGSVVLLLAICAGSAAAADYTVAYGDPVTIYVSNPFGETAYLYIQGTNFPFSPLLDASGDQVTVYGKGRSVEIDTTNINNRHPDAGTYTIYVSNNPDATGPGNLASRNGYWDAYSLTLRPIGFTVNTVSTPTVTATPVPTAPATAVPTILATPTPEPTTTPVSPGPILGLLAGLCLVVLRR